MAASMLARALSGTGTAITVVESPEIATVGVGEATIPPIIELLQFLSIDAADFVRHTQATYKLGIQFVDWKQPGHTYWHPFGTFGVSINRRPFYHCWQTAQARGHALRFEDFSPCAALANSNKFRFPDRNPLGETSGVRYALHFDAILVARYLRAYAERLGVTRLERTVRGTTLSTSGLIDALHFSDGSQVRADLYIDCSGFRGVLIEEALGTGYVDWSELLPCNRAVAFPTPTTVPRSPYTRSLARPAGWQWTIPLQNRTGNGYVYCSSHCNDEEALEDLLRMTGGQPSAEPRFLRFVSGRRQRFWNRNCIALGLASGFLEPLESTSIHLVASGLYHLLEHFPDTRFDQANIDSYNRELAEEWERIRDFIVLHYYRSQREDSAFWRSCRSLRIPDSLRERIELYEGTGRIRPRQGELFTDLSWFYILDGLGTRAATCDPFVDVIPPAKLNEILTSLAGATAALVEAAPTHDSYFNPGI